MLPSVELSDSELYSCYFANEQGSSFATGNLTVFATREELEAATCGSCARAAADRQGRKNWLFLYIGVSVASLVFVIVIVVVVVTLRARVRAERRRKDIATEAFLNVYQWTKHVLVEKRMTEGGDCVIEPKVYIEKRKCVKNLLCKF